MSSNPVALSTRDRIDAFGKLVALLVFVFGVLTYFLDQFSSRTLIRAEQSQNAISDFSNNGIEDFILDFNLRVSPYFKYSDLNDPADIDQVDFSKIFRSVMFEPNGQHDPMLVPFVETIGFFERVYSCRESMLCDPSSVDDFFCGRIIEFSSLSERFRSQIQGYFALATFSASFDRFVADCKEP